MNNFRNYKKILITTGAHLNRLGYVKRNNGIKSLLVQKLFPSKTRRTTCSTMGKGLNFLKNLTIDRSDVYYDDPNELVTHLQMLLKSHKAGNNSYSIEINSILEELRKSHIIY